MSADDPMSEHARRAFVRSTTLDGPTGERLRARLATQQADEHTLREDVLRVTTPDDRVLGRIRARIRETRSSRGGLGWALGLAGAGVAAAAGIALWPAADQAPSLPLANVSLAFHGEGRIAGTEQSPVIEWEDGTVSVTVTPHQGVHLAVSTPEATVRVVGTVFSVDRSSHATRVVVTEGTVEVACVGRPILQVHGGGQATCLPIDLPNLLIRVTELARAGAPAEERLATIDPALVDAADSSAVRGELLAHRARALADAGRFDDAIAAAEAYLATPESARRAELIAFVARTAYQRGGCAALGELERAAVEAPSGTEALLLASCVVDRDPERARALLGAAGPSATGEWRRVADGLAERLRATP